MIVSTVSIANDVACKGLDWLETRFTVLHTPTEQVTFYFPLSDLIEPHKLPSFPQTAQEATTHLPWFLPVSPRLLPLPRTRFTRSRTWWALQLMAPWTAYSTHSRGWWGGPSRPMTRLTCHFCREPSVWPVWDWTLLWSCQRLWWIGCFLPPKKRKVHSFQNSHSKNAHLPFVCHSKCLLVDFIEEAVRLLGGFEADTLRGSYPARLVSLAAKLCTRTYHMVGSKMQTVQVCCEYSLKELFSIFREYAHLLSWRELGERIDASLICPLNIQLQPAAG